ncbi:MAG: hypothetical protein LBS03_00015 [Bacteroidales bacterium]|nr:hypothetical protein [Bacteroidales bacterium]
MIIWVSGLTAQSKRHEPEWASIDSGSSAKGKYSYSEKKLTLLLPALTPATTPCHHTWTGKFKLTTDN